LDVLALFDLAAAQRLALEGNPLVVLAVGLGFDDGLPHSMVSIQIRAFSFDVALKAEDADLVEKL
jgi:hypothetical protein